MKSALSIAVVLGATLVCAGCPGKTAEGVVKNNEDPGVGKTFADPAKPEAPKVLTGAEIVERYKACTGFISGAKWDDYKAQCVDGSYRNHPIAATPELKGPDAAIAFFKNMKAAFPDWALEPQLVLVSHRNIFGVVRTSGTHTGAMKTPAGDVPASNKKTAQLMFHRLEINDANKASDEWAIVDSNTLLAHLGLAPTAVPARPVMEKGWEGAPIAVVGTDDAKEKANLEVMTKARAAFDGRKIADILALTHADAMISDQMEAADVKGKAGLEKGLTELYAVFPDAKTDKVESWAAGDYVVSIGKLQATHKKSGKKVSMDFAEVVKVKDGLILELYRFRNGLELSMQLAPPAPPEKAPATK